MLTADSHLVPITRPYRLDRTLACGQTFRWRWRDGTAAGVFAGRQVKLIQQPDGIRVEGLRERAQVETLRRHLGVDEPLETIEQALCRDRMLRRIVPHTTGIALMRQDPWECLVSFVVSAFNNIPKIELTLERLCRRFGSPVAPDAWSFPAPVVLAAATVRDLRSCLLGYRAPYLSGIAKRIAEDDLFLSAPADRPYDEARRLLLTLPGVGPKVADCVLLFAYGKGEAFPVDVWVRRAVERWYLHSRPASERRIREVARERFGIFAGYAQQHLYYYIRQRGHRTTRQRD